MASTRKRGKTWSYRVSIQDKNGKPKTKEKGGFKTKREAEMAGKRFEADYEANKNILKGDQSFYDFYMEYFNEKKKPNLGMHSIKAYERDGRRIKEFFKNKKLNEITNIDYQHFLNDFATNHAKASTEKLHAHVKSSLTYAFNNGYIPTNPAFDVVIKGEVKTKDPNDKFVDEFELKLIIKWLLDGLKYEYTSRYFLLLAIATGARAGELLALTYDDFDTEGNTVNINKSYDYSHTHDFKSTKNSQSNRIITVDQSTSKRFKSYILNRKMFDRQRQGNPKQLLFNDLKSNQPITVAAVNKTLTKACKQNNIKRITCHGLRHTHASILLKNKMPIEYISHRLGHQSSAITQSVYLHVIKEFKQIGDDQATDYFGQILGKQA